MTVRNEVPMLACELAPTREARIARDGEGAAIGAAVFFTPDDLADLGIDPALTDAVELRIVNGRVSLRPVETATRSV